MRRLYFADVLALFPLPSIFFTFHFQIFEGNSNYDTPELRIVEPLLTRLIRIYPERATPAGMGLRLELLGCEIEGIKSLAFSMFCLNKLKIPFLTLRIAPRW